MKNRLLLFLFLPIVMSVETKQLTHICAYTNKSVVKFRKNMLIRKALDQLSHPGQEFDWPVDLCQFWISSLYGPRTFQGVKKMHSGVDMAANHGTKVKVAADGIVKKVSKNNGAYGNMIEVAHKNGTFTTRYAHLHDMHVKSGDKVKKGNVIGLVGATGNARGKDGSHLHFELEQKGKRINPLMFLYWAEAGYPNQKNLLSY